MRKEKLFKKILFVVLVFTSVISESQETVTFSIANISNEIIEKGVGSMNSCWLLDSDIERQRNTSNEERWAEMQLGSVRYPYGLGENYLWDTPPYGSSPLVPKIASTSYHPGILKLANWSWATNADGSINKSMDFDEFMGICQRQNIKPLIVVSTQAHKYPNGPTYQELKTTAVEWVKYAKLKNYEVAYWQIGNEVDGHTDLLPEEEYYDLYIDFVTAMKAADPSIFCGIGTKARPIYFNTLMARAPELIDFHSVHQYLFDNSITNYSTWLNHNGTDLNTNVANTQNVINRSSKPNLPLLITETNAFGNWKTTNGSNDNTSAMYKGLCFFDMLMTQQSYENVVYSFVWNSHSAWFGENGSGGVANALTNDMDNKITPIGMPIKILNTTAEEHFMVPDNKVHGSTYSYGTYTPSTGKSTIYLLNKSLSSVSMNVNIGNYDMSSGYERWVWASTSDQYAAESTFVQTGSITQTSGGFTTSIPPYSLVVVKLNGTQITQVSNIENFVDNVGSNLRMKSNTAGNDVISTAISDNSLLAQWEIVDAVTGYVFIQNKSNGMRLQGTSANTGVETSVKLVAGTSNGDWVQWRLTPVDSNWYIDNKAHNTRLGVNNAGEIIVSPISETSTMLQWGSNNSLSTSETLLEPSGILIYPNSIKAGDNFNLHYTSYGNNHTLKIRVIDISGKVVLNREENLRNGLNKFTIQSNRLSHGLYFVEFSSAGRKDTKKIIVK